MSDELWQLSACDTAAGIRSGRFSCREVMESVVGRIRARNPALNAIVYDHTEAALAAAARFDAELASGRPLGPLHGVPVTIKENIDVAGQPTPNGVPDFERIVAPDDSPLVRSLVGAGAIIVGRTNVPEFSMRVTTDNPLHGRTANPWDSEASPGGSSGGAGAAAAAGFGAIHHGNDIGGSLRIPAFACGVATVKPGLGRVPAYNPSATAERGLLAQLMSVQGAICREVRDVRLATEVMAQRDARDPWWVPVPFAGEPIARPVRVAFTQNAHGYPMHGEIRDALARAAGWLSEAGYRVEEVEPPSIREPASAWFDIAVAEMRQLLFPLAKQHGSPTIQRMFEWFTRLGSPVDGPGYVAGVAERTRMTRAWSVFLEQYPLVLTPFLMRPTFAWNYDAQGFDQMKDVMSALVYSYGINYLGLPAGVVPVGFAGGLPCAVQIVGRRFREDSICDALAALEARAGVFAKQLWAREA
jgi:amidase